MYIFRMLMHEPYFSLSKRVFSIYLQLSLGAHLSKAVQELLTSAKHPHSPIYMFTLKVSHFDLS